MHLEIVILHTHNSIVGVSASFWCLSPLPLCGRNSMALIFDLSDFLTVLKVYYWLLSWRHPLVHRVIGSTLWQNRLPRKAWIYCLYNCCAWICLLSFTHYCPSKGTNNLPFCMHWTDDDFCIMLLGYPCHSCHSSWSDKGRPWLVTSHWWVTFFWANCWA